MGSAQSQGPRPPKLAQGLEKATDEQLAEVEILGAGFRLHWEALDADLSVRPSRTRSRRDTACRTAHVRTPLGHWRPDRASSGLCGRPKAPQAEPFGWIKAAAGLRQTRHRGLSRVGWMVTLTAAACNLVRLPKLLANAE